MANTKTDLRPVLHNACHRIGDCKGAVSIAIDRLCGDGDEEMVAHAVGALCLARNELERLQDDLDAVWLKSAYVVDKEVSDG